MAEPDEDLPDRLSGTRGQGTSSQGWPLATPLVLFDIRDTGTTAHCIACRRRPAFMRYVGRRDRHSSQGWPLTSPPGGWRLASVCWGNIPYLW
ncbi:MAG: hypothetical protein RQM92_04325 [Candidatus Syntrophopropionicum ammoniitolerans]